MIRNVATLYMPRFPGRLCFIREEAYIARVVMSCGLRAYYTISSQLREVRMSPKIIVRACFVRAHGVSRCRISTVIEPQQRAHHDIPLDYSRPCMQTEPLQIFSLRMFIRRSLCNLVAGHSCYFSLDGSSFEPTACNSRFYS